MDAAENRIKAKAQNGMDNRSGMRPLKLIIKPGMRTIFSRFQENSGFNVLVVNTSCKCRKCKLSGLRFLVGEKVILISE
jgi:hypothetical protein